MSDVVKTRIMIRKEEMCEPVSAAHGWAFESCEGIRPANTLIVASLIGEAFLVEIEAEAHVSNQDPRRKLVVT